MNPEVLEARVASALEGFGMRGARVCVGFSGGVDSSVLLDVLVRLAPRLRLQLCAVHVNHGLNPRAADWAAFCIARCHAHRVDVQVSELALRVDAGAGIEAAARTARHAVFAQQPADAVALAHNLDDQIETMLLRITRGAGMRGLAGMPALRALSEGGPHLVRPLLDTTRAEILVYALQRGIEWIEDESNAQTLFDRNFVRHEVLPRLEQRFPAYRQTWARASANLADAAEVLDEVAAQDAGAALAAGSLELSRLRMLGPARARNLLHWFIVRSGGTVASRERLQEALRQILHARSDRHPELTFGEVVLRRHGDHVEAAPSMPAAAHDWEVRWGGEDLLCMPHGLGALRFDAVSGRGLSRRRLLDAGVRVCLRRSGGRLKLAADRPTRTLKNLLHEGGVPPWQRQRLPAIYAGDTLVWVARVGMDCRFAAAAGEAGVIPQWLAPGALERESCEA
jgi:tRNA(Ile)-lysidine synthase